MAKYKKVKAGELKKGDIAAMDFVVTDTIGCPFSYHDVEVLSAKKGFDTLFECDCIFVTYRFFDQDRTESRNIPPDKIIEIRINPPTEKELEQWAKQKEKYLLEREEFKKRLEEYDKKRTSDDLFF